ncbi:MAG: phosphoenolpyruvate--protein phosphotransferase [Kiritimatiellae bacterium]|nr:phosphoenolpyruvate--protein phosphotransferase [Kiritimatiellia bacterium]
MRSNSGVMRVFKGLPASHGQVAGTVYVFRKKWREQVPEYDISAVLISSEIERLQEAFTLTRHQIHSLSAELCKRVSGSESATFEGHVMILDDPVVIDKCQNKIKEQLCNAEWAVHSVVSEYAAIFESMEDEYLRERVNDIYDIGSRLIRNLLGVSDMAASLVTKPCIIVAEELSPSETISLPRHLIMGFATDRGSLTSHASLISRALGIPAVVGIGNLSEIAANGDYLLVDGTSGTVILHPDQNAIDELNKAAEINKTFNISLEELKNKLGQTKDNVRVPLIANIDSGTTISDLEAVGAEGVGLYRSEYLWLALNREPTEDEQTEAYTRAVRALEPDQEITIRVLDLGGDKIIANSKKPGEANPFLGNRSIRYLLRNPDVFKRQLRAVLRSSVHGKLQIMYPMITVLEELRETNQILAECMDELRREGRGFNENIKQGVMVEVPGAALIADSLAVESDFFSIGTNDLIQYTLAVDRLNESVARLYQPAHPAVLQLIDMTIKAGHAHNSKITVCGEMASDPVMAVLLYGMGVDEFSMTPNMIPLVKKVFSCIIRDDALQLAAEVRGMYAQEASTLYQYCKEKLLRLVPNVPL